MKIMKKLMMLAAFVALSVPTFSKKYDVFKDVFAEMDQQIASSNRGPLQVTLYRVCTPNRLGFETGCDKASAVYMRRLNAMTGNRDVRQIFKDTYDGIKPFESPEDALKEFVNTERDKYDLGLATGFEVKDAKGKVCARRDMARYGFAERIKNASTVLSVSLKLTPKAEVNNKLEIWDRITTDTPHENNDRRFCETVVSLLKNHTLSNPELYLDMNGITPFEQYYAEQISQGRMMK